MELPSFKILGASWATYRVICDYVGIHIDELPSIDVLKSALAKGERPTLVAATDGNHGRAISRMARLLELPAEIFVPSNMVASRVDALRVEGATVTVVQGSYDETVRKSAQSASSVRLVVSDTSWPGYEKIPSWVIDGYSTLGTEIEEQLRDSNLRFPTVVGAQIGVGAFAAAMVRFFAPRGVRVIGIEPTQADCVSAGFEAGRIVTLDGSQNSIMSGLNCGTASPVAWPDLQRGLESIVVIDDEYAAQAMRVLAADGIVSGESGAAGLAGLIAFRDELEITEDDDVLVVSTEGATDPDGYAQILAEG